MRVDQIRRRMWLAATTVSLLSLAATVADRTGSLNSVRPVIHDALSPGRLMLLAISPQQEPHDSLKTDEVRVSATEVARRERLLRRLMIENACLRRDLKREQIRATVLDTIEPLTSLVRHELVRASIISSSGMSTSLRELILDAGRSSGITRSELVIDGSDPVLDAGTEDLVSAGDRVLTGAIVVGRIEKAARWVSMVQPITAAGFKARVQLLRQTPEGLHPGAICLLEGTGEPECVLNGIPHTEAVAPGDEVVTADVNGIRGLQLYFGRVTRAEFLAGGQWDIRVQPAAALDQLDSVGILRFKLIADRPKSHPENLDP